MKFSKILDKYWITKPIIARVGFEPSALSLEFRTASLTQRQTQKIHREKDKMRTATERAHAVIFFPLSCFYYSNLTLKIANDWMAKTKIIQQW